MIVKDLTINTELQPSGLYEGQFLDFGLVNYIIGKNGTGKSQVMRKIYEKAKNEVAIITATKKGISIKYLPAIRTTGVSGSRALHASDVDQHETNSVSAEDFYQFLHESPFTKTLVEHQIKEFFHKEPKIQVKGQSITFNIFDRAKKLVRRLLPTTAVAPVEGATKKPEDLKSTEYVDELLEEMRELNLGNESDGMKELLILLTYIYHPRVKAVLIDETESHLHPHMINFVMDAITDVVSHDQKQFFIITHSATAIKLVPSSDWRYFFFRKEEELAKSKISCFKEFGEAKFKRLMRELNPYKREAFYSDSVILVEGVEDFYFLTALAKMIGYAEYDGGGMSFFPCWGGDQLELYHDFFVACGKTVYVVADKNITTRQPLTSGFKGKFTSDSDRFIKLSKNDITEFFTNAESNKLKKTFAEIDLIESGSFQEVTYKELVDIIRKILGTKKPLRPSDEFTGMVHRLVNEFQMRMADQKEWQDVLAKADREALIAKIQADDDLRPYWQDSVIDEFIFAFDPAWSCHMVFKSGRHHFVIDFSRDTRPADVYPITP